MEKVYMRTDNDCMVACYATVLGIAYEEVPRFYDDNDVEIDNWVKVRDQFLAQFGLQSISFEYTHSILYYLKGLVLVSGPSVSPKFEGTDVHHAVIYKDGKLWHDPKPNPFGVVKPNEIELLVPILGDRNVSRT